MRSYADYPVATWLATPTQENAFVIPTMGEETARSVKAAPAGRHSPHSNGPLALSKMCTDRAIEAEVDLGFQATPEGLTPLARSMNS